MYKHYIRLDSQKQIIKGFSSAFLEPNGNEALQDTDICINEQGDYQFRLFADGVENPLLIDFNGISIYKYVNGEILVRTDEDKALELVKIEKQRQIPILKAQLQSTDYKVIKQSEAICASITPLPYTEEEMASMYAERQALRDKINELEGSITV